MNKSCYKSHYINVGAKKCAIYKLLLAVFVLAVSVFIVFWSVNALAGEQKSTQSSAANLQSTSLSANADVAEIVETGAKYSTVQDAITAVAAQLYTVKMLTDSTENVTIATGGKVILDLNDHVLSAPSAGGTIITCNGEQFTLIDSSGATTETHYFTYHKPTALTAWGYLASPTAEQIASAISVDEVDSETAEGAIVKVDGGVITGGTSTGVIINSGTMTINDGNIIGNSAGTEDAGGGLDILASCSCFFNNGRINGNYAMGKSNSNGGGGVRVKRDNDARSAARFSMTGGRICNNSTSGFGGAIDNIGWTLISSGLLCDNYSQAGGAVFTGNYNSSQTTGTIFTLSGDACLSSNVSTDVGGGISTGQYGSVKLSGGEITDNQSGSDGGGVEIWSANNALTVGGKLVVKDNKKVTANSESVNNLFLDTDQVLTIDSTTPLTTGSSIGVITKTKPSQGGTLAITGTNADVYSQYFTSDDSTYTIINDASASNTVQLYYPADGKALVVETGVTYDTVQAAINAVGNQDQTVKMFGDFSEDITIAADGKVKLDLNNHILKGTGSGAVITCNGAEFTLTDDSGVTEANHYFTYHQKAVWEYIASPSAEQKTSAVYVDDINSSVEGDMVVKVDKGVVTGSTDSAISLQGGNLTLSNANIVGNSSVVGGGLCVYEGCVATMNSGRMCGNYASGTENGGGAVRVNATYRDSATNLGQFILNDGRICNNCAHLTGGGINSWGNVQLKGGFVNYNYCGHYDSATSKYYGGGGGVYSGSSDDTAGGLYYKHSELEITGDASISGNISLSWGGGISTNNNGYVHLYGGSITNNQCGGTTGGGGVEIWSSTNALTVAGKVVVENNKMVTSNTESANNVYLDGDSEAGTYQTLTIGSDLTEGSCLGITTGYKPDKGAKVPVSGTNSADYSQYFKSDDTTYTIVNDANTVKLYNPNDGNALIVETGVKYPTVQEAITTVGAQAQTVRMLADFTEDIEVAAGGKVTLDLNNYVLKGTGSTANSVITCNGESFTLTDSNTSTATYHYFKYHQKTAWEYYASPSETEKSGATSVDDVTSSTTDETIVKVDFGVVTGGASSGVHLNSGVMTITKGNIIGNTSYVGGGLTISSATTCTMNSGRINGNHAKFNDEKKLGGAGGVKLLDADASTGTLAKFTLNNGSVCNNSAESEGGGFSNAGSLIICGGSVNYNCSDDMGGAVYSGSNGSKSAEFELSGSAIMSGNIAKGNGGAISTNNEGYVNLYGGEITNNQSGAPGGGVEIWSSSNALKVGGKVVVKDNKMVKDGVTTDNNIYLQVLDEGNSLLTIDQSNPLTTGSSLGITTGYKPAEAESVPVTNVNTADYSQYFTSDDSTYIIINEDNTVKLNYPGKALVVETTKTYKTVQEAITAVGSQDQTVRMLADFTENIVVAAEGKVTLDLYDHVLSAPSEGGTVITCNGSEFTLTDTTDQSGEAAANHYFTYHPQAAWEYIASPTEAQKTAAKFVDDIDSSISENDVIKVDKGVVTEGKASGISLNSGKITITDGSVIGNSAADGGGLVVLEGCTTTMNSGRINGNYANENGGDGGGGVLLNRSLESSDAELAKFILNDGRICNNYAYWSGGGIDNWGDTQIKGGVISYNSSAHYDTGGTARGGGGGVYTGSQHIEATPYKSAKFEMSNNACMTYNKTVGWGGGISTNDQGYVKLHDVQITNNQSGLGAGGVEIYSATNSLYVGGKVVVKDNKKVTANDESVDNVYLDGLNSTESGKSFYRTLIINPLNLLTDDSSIGVNTGYKPDKAKVVPVSGANDKDYTEYFTSDDTTYTIINEDDTVKLGNLKAIGDCTIGGLEDQTYKGSEIKPVTVKDGETALTEGTDYTITYKDNTNAGTATATIKGMGHYDGSVTKTFTIKQANMNSTEVADVGAVTYKGSAYTPTPEVKLGDFVLTAGTDFDYSYTSNTNAGTATITMTGKNVNFTGTQTKTFEINKATITVTPDSGQSKIYDGTTAQPTYSYDKPVASEEPSFEGNLGLYDNAVNVGTYDIVKNSLALANKGTFLASNYEMELPETAVKYEIKKATPVIDPFTCSDVAYGTAPSPSATSTFGTPVFSYSDTEGGTFKEWSTTNPPGTYYVKAYVEATANWNSAEKVISFKVKKTSESISIGAIADQTYTGAELKPGLTVTDNEGKTLTTDDYTATYKDNINAGTANVTVTGQKGYSGLSATQTFKINKATPVIDPFTCSDVAYGTAPSPSATSTFGTPTFSYSDTEGGTFKEWSTTNPPGTYYVKAYVAESTNWNSAEKVISFKVNKTSESISIGVIADQTYTGQPLTPALTVTDNEGKTLTTEDYTATYKDNINAGTANVTVAGQKGYSGLSATQTFKINKATPVIDPFTCSDVAYGIAPSPSATSTFGTPTFSYSDTESGTFKEWSTTNLPGTYYVKAYVAESTNWNSAEKVISFKVNKTSESISIGAIADQTYTGQPLTPAFTVTDKEGKTLTTEDYTATYKDNINAGTANVTVTGQKGYSGLSATQTFKIKKATPVIDPFTCSDVVYGTAPSPSATSTFGTPTFSYSDTEGGTFKEWSTANLPGKYYVKAYVAESTNWNSAEKVISFKVNKTSESISIGAIADQTYTGQPLTPALTVTDKEGKTLTADDFTATYTNNTNAGTANVTVAGQKGYSGLSATQTFNITKAKVTVPTAKTGLVYNGSEQTGIEMPLSETRYTLSNNTGTNATSYNAIASLTDKNNYQWDLTSPSSEDQTIAWSIAKANMNTTTVAEVTAVEYTGSAHTPQPAVTLGTLPLTKDTDFTYSYNNNINAGTATITMTAKEGNFTGTQTKTFTINKRAVTLTSGSAKQEYNGSAISAKNVEVTSGSFVESEKSQISYTNFAERTDVGVSSNSFDIVWGSALSTNYETTLVLGTLEITSAATSDIKIDTQALEDVKQKYQESPSDKVSVDLVVSADNIKPSDVEKIQAKAGDKKLTTMDATLVVKVNGITQEDAGTNNDTLIAVTYNFDFENRSDFEFYRVHNDTLAQLTDDPNEYDETATYDQEEGTITISAKKYSAYSVAYNEGSTPTPDPGDDASALSSTTSSTSDPIPPLCLGVLLIAALGALIAGIKFTHAHNRLHK